MTDDLEIFSARFETLPKPLGPGWVMRVTATARNIRRIAFPFEARLAQQPVEFLCVSLEGDLFEGYLRRIPQPGDRLFVGYLQANSPTPVVYQPQISGPVVASRTRNGGGVIGSQELVEAPRGSVSGQVDPPTLSPSPSELDISSSTEAFTGTQPAGPPMPKTPPLPASLPAVAGALRRTDGIDLFCQNALPTWTNLRNAGISFLIHKCSEGRTITDPEFSTRYHDTRANGFIRGAFHYYWHADGVAGSVQGDKVVGAVERLRPGDLAPALDFEGDAVPKGQKEPGTAAEWRTELMEFLDTVETKLGRIPWIYTKTNAWNHLSGEKDYVAANYASFGNYPLWVVSYSPRHVTVLDTSQNPPTNVNVDLEAESKFKADLFQTAAGQAGETRYTAQRLAGDPLPVNLPGPWGNNWSIWQYSDFTPSSLRNHGFGDWKLDFDVTHQGIYFLRGFADLGRPAPHLVGNLNLIAWANADRTLHLFEYVNNSWVEDARVARAGAPAAAGDPAAIGIGNEELIIYRAGNDHIIALTRSILDSAAVPWVVTDISNSPALDDPFVLIFQNEIHVLFGNEDNRHVHLTRTRGAWQTELFADPNPVGTVSGSSTGYVHDGALHIVSRAGDRGQLLDFAAPSGSAAPLDLTANPYGVRVPPATYRPATYLLAGHAPRIVFRALHGNIWQIERDTLNATDLSAASGAPVAWGSPSAVVAGGVHILYRGKDSAINEIFDGAGPWRTRQVASEAAADPVTFLDPYGHAAVSFRALNGRVRIARCVNNAWIVEDVG